MGTFACAAAIGRRVVLPRLDGAPFAVANQRRAAKSCIIRPLLCARLEAAQTVRRVLEGMVVAGKYAILLYLTLDFSIIT
ncbi:MAG TPA: hypothetical protein VFS02_23200 [Telluria sp.]|nr:hypothetical protein [Telluria sp.]